MFDLFADVAVRLPLTDLFTYRVPEELVERIEAGKRVQVSLRNVPEEGLVCRLHRHPPDFATLPIQKLIDTEPALNDDQLRLGAWMADYYLAGPGECLFKMFPGGKRNPPRMADSKRRKAGDVQDFAPAHDLNAAQASVFDAVLQDFEAGAGRRPRTHVVHGITGSGKTEIYIHTLLEALRRGRGALLLVPEISLTVQLIERLQAVFGDELALLHSALSGGDRRSAYMHVLRGDKRIAVGTRSAVFAPVQNPGVIILDEEHDGSYKEHSAPRYDARQIAHKRAADHGAVLLLGSATPRIETAYAARVMQDQTGFVYHSLGERATGAELPPVRRVKIASSQTPITGELLHEIDLNLKAKQQSILLLNRRGYNPFVYCASCETTQSCPNCSVALNLHKNQRLVCHYCAYTRPYRGACETCGGPAKPVGSGTQKLEEYLLNLFPNARLERLDTDAAAKRNTVRDCIARLIAGEIDILLGTQMIAKGLDAPGVTLVGVLQADHGLAMPDFRSAERTFALLTQVAGRAGRGELKGRVIFECLNPENPVIVNAARQEYEAFYREEITNRDAAVYPPFCRVIRLLYRSDDDERARAAMERLHLRLSRRLLAAVGAPLPGATAGREGASGGAVTARTRLESTRELATILGPAPAPLEKLHNQYRHHMILKTLHMKRVRQILAELLPGERARSRDRLHLEVDLDPVDLL
ncbi:MAG: primosomal protein N' [Leptospirales bacterium]|jgi:primosomal protein N' (replication factor Y)